MASDSPRARIDQFFSSKKKRAISPAVKSGRSKKEVEGSKEASPSAKCSLDSYLVKSQNEKKSSKEGLVKRNLTLEIGLLLNNETKEPSSYSEKETGNLVQNGSDIAEAGIAAVGGDEKTTAISAHAQESSHINQFATEFLSLHCSFVKPGSHAENKSNDHKRRGSPSTIAAEDKTSKKRHSVAVSEPLHSDNAYPSSDHGKSEIHPLESVVDKPETVLQFHKKVENVNNDGQRQISLRKCTKTTSSASPMESSTPCSVSTMSHVRGTPRSGRGRLMISPGDEFWDEAIQVADGLLVPNGNICEAGGNEKETWDAMNHKSTSQFRPECFDGRVEVGPREESSCIQGRAISGFSGLPNKQGKDQDGGPSPLPIKRFDFTLEDRNLDENSKQILLTGNVEVSEKKVHCNQEHASAGQKAPITLDGQVTQAIKGGMGVSAEESFGHVEHQQQVNPKLHESKSISSDSPDTGNRNLVITALFDGSSTPSSSLPIKDNLDLSNWVPAEVCHIYRHKGLSRLYQWQVDCLQVEGVMQRRNLVYCASTSAGKSFVAEILMLRMVIKTRKMAILVLPYVSICTEKAEHLEALLEPLGKRVRSYYGNQGGGTLPKETSVAVCTIEKANSLLNRLLEEGRLSEVGIIVIDELHMVADPHRGYLLELMLTKLRYAAGEGNCQSSSGESSGTSSCSRGDAARGLQIVGMSATMPNVASVAEWLNAALYQTEFRPVPLEEYIKVGNSIYNKSMELVRTIPKSADLGGKDPDHVAELCNEVIQEGNSVLLFCSSRKGCESTAKHVAKYLKKFSAKVQDEQCEFADCSAAIDALKKCPVGLDPVLEETLPSGVAYHHAGLTVEEREIVETCYRKGLIRVLTATSTLAAGVNLPARRVIFRQPRIGRDFLDVTRYRQMAGRAGRTGIDAKGESVLICKPEEIKRIKTLLNGSCPPLQSCLSEDKNGMTHAILEVVAGGIVQTANDIHRYVRCTLLNCVKPFEDVVKSAQDSLRWLCHRKFLKWNEDTKLYSAIPLGRASFGSSLSPEESLIVLDDLSRAREGFVLASDLHIVYLVTPVNIEVEPNWESLYEKFVKLSPLDQSVGNRIGVLEPFLMRMAHGVPLRSAARTREDTKGLHGYVDAQLRSSTISTLSDEQSLRVCRRFYVALILSCLVQELPVGEVCEAFNVARGFVQSLQDNAGRFASMVSVFCERLGWHDLEGLISKFQNRVSFGVRAEIAELTMIPYVKGSRARALYKAGLRTAQAIAEASVRDIAKALFESSSWVAQENMAQQRLQFGVAKKIKNGARKIILDKAEEARAAVFSAFKSLGFDIPQFPVPPLTAAVDQQAELNNSAALGGEASRFTEIKHHDNQITAGTSRDGNDNVSKVGPQTYKLNMKATVDSGEFVQNSVGGSTLKTEMNYSSSVGNDNLKDMSDNGGHRLVGGQQTTKDCSNSFTDKGPVSVSSLPGGLDYFLNLWDSVSEFFFDVHFRKKMESTSDIAFEVHGIAICWDSSPVYYVNFDKDLFSSGTSSDISSSTGMFATQGSSLLVAKSVEVRTQWWTRIGKMMGKRNVRKYAWNLKFQIQALKYALVPTSRSRSESQTLKNSDLGFVEGLHHKMPPIVAENVIDVGLVTWILWPDEERSSSPNLEKEVKKRLSGEAAAAATRSGRWKNQMRRAAHNGCCRRVAQTRALCSVLWNLLSSEELEEALTSIEAPLVHVLADMEAWGIGVDMEGCLKARHLLSTKLKLLEKEAHKFAGTTFSLNTPADIAHVLYERLKLPVPEGRITGKHASTDKHCLDLLRNEHPIIPVIKEHRTLAKLFHSTLGTMCKLSKLCTRTQKYMLHGHWLQTSTATGRLSMEEPNLQCVEHMINFDMYRENVLEYGSNEEHYKVNVRDFFIPTEDNWLLVTADYSQIELRVMAHFSKDSHLIELLSKPQGDVFTMMASRWTGKGEADITSQEREQIKKLVYGILYGMGANSLAEQISCSPEEAKLKIKSFKSSFPGVGSWLQEAVSFCRQKGYVQTLKGRKRFLSKIKLGNDLEKSKAQRQAVNSICQGSAADIIKIAMLNIYSVIAGVDEPSSSNELAKKFHMLKNRCRILLQVHDELVLEAEPTVIREAALLLKTCMESAASLQVPLQVKMKIGKSWGSLEPYDTDS